MFIEEVTGNNGACWKSCRRQEPKTLIYMERLQERLLLWFLISEVWLQWEERVVFIGRIPAQIREGLGILPWKEFNSSLNSSKEILDFSEDNYLSWSPGFSGKFVHWLEEGSGRIWFLKLRVRIELGFPQPSVFPGFLPRFLGSSCVLGLRL